MRCINPYRMKNPQFPENSNLEYIDCACGKCFPCLVNRRNQWLFRLTNEALSHSFTSFVTLTYDDEFLPEDGLLKRSDFTKFLKRLRKRVGRLKVYGIGEYGTTTFRPHMHFIGFHDDVDYDKMSFCVAESWKFGFTSCYPSNIVTINYVLHYHVRPKNPIPWNKKAKTFCCFSKRLGLSYLFNPDGTFNNSVVSLFTKSTSRCVSDIYSRHFIVPRYYTKKLEEMGFVLKKPDTIPDYSIYPMRTIIQQMYPDIEFYSDGTPKNFDDYKFLDLMNDIIVDSEIKLKRYNYQTKTSI